MTSTEKRASVIGIGMIGGSIAAALKAQGWHVSGSDLINDRVVEAQARGIVDAVGFDKTASLTFVATPVSRVVEAAEAALKHGGLVTDVASVKGAIVASIDNPNFIGGHPMAGSEKSGLDGVDADLFQGATWVLTPAPTSDANALQTISSVISSLGAAVVQLDPAQHDQIVATISHVPHLTASALMTSALTSKQDHDVVLRVAAGGFRDMTRIAAGDPDLWVDIVTENKDAIEEELSRLANHVKELQDIVAANDSSQLRAFLATAAKARQELPIRSGRPSHLSFVRIPIPDRAGALGEVLTVFGFIQVNVEDLEISHDLKGDRGYLQITVATADVDKVKEAFNERSIRVSVES